MIRATLLSYWGKQLHNLGLGMVTLIEHNLGKIDLLIKLIGVKGTPPLRGNTHIGLGVVFQSILD